MLKNNIIHSRMLLHQIKEDNTGIFYQHGFGKSYFTKCKFIPYTAPEPIVIDDTFVNFIPQNIRFSQCFGTSDKITPCGYIVVVNDIYNKFLYYVEYNNTTSTYELKFVRNAPTCYMVCGGSNETNGFAISAGVYHYLYRLKEDHAVMCGNTDGWSHISGHCYEDNGTKHYAYGIAKGKLYRLYCTEDETSIVQVGSSNTWTFIQGYCKTSVKSNTFGINSGRLYSIQNTTTTRIGSDTNWKEVRGTFDNNECVLGLKTNGELHVIYYTLSNLNIRTQRVGTSYSWTDITEHYGICDGKLYYIDFNSINGNFDVKQVGTFNKWTKVTGSSKLQSHTYGICNNSLYDIYELNAREVSRNCLNIYGAEQGAFATIEC